MAAGWDISYIIDGGEDVFDCGHCKFVDGFPIGYSGPHDSAAEIFSRVFEGTC
mgnify:CR=1 FL=1